MPVLSVITPASRGVKELSQLLRDFRAQTFRDFEHVIVFDGTPPADVVALMKREGGPNTIFCSIPKDVGDMTRSPGTKPRNHGMSIASGEYVCFCDDDDRYKDTYCETLMTGTRDNVITVVQMSCQESRMYKNGSPDRTVLVPEAGLPFFPIICHMGTPCFVVKREWALAEPWRHEPEHDFRFIKRIMDRYKPSVRFAGGMQVDVDGIVTRGIRDFVSRPPFWRD